MLLGVAVGSGALYCYNECNCNNEIKQTINKVKKKAENKLENMMEKQFHKKLFKIAVVVALQLMNC